MTHKTDQIDKYRQRTMGTTFRGDMRTVATLALFWKSKGEPMRSLNSVLRLTLEGMRELILDQHPDFEITSTSMAVEVLKELNLLDLKKDFPNKKSLLKELSIESLSAEGIDPTKKLLKKVKHEKEDLGPYMSQHDRDKLARELEEQMELEVIVPEEVLHARELMEQREADLDEQQKELGKKPEGEKNVK